jgi:hypothetical protein
MLNNIHFNITYKYFTDDISLINMGNFCPYAKDNYIVLMWVLNVCDRKRLRALSRTVFLLFTSHTPYPTSPAIFSSYLNYYCHFRTIFSTVTLQ